MSRVAFLVAIAKLNPHGTAHGSSEELQVALTDLWQFIAERGGDVCPIPVPVLGTGYSRIAEPRHEAIREIVRSFLAACAERTFREKLTIVISPKDFSSHEIDFAELSDCVRLSTKYASTRKSLSSGVGTPVAAPESVMPAPGADGLPSPPPAAGTS